ncbi:MAG: tetratricopeptide repeat protein [Raineya sp.]|jgi:serine phosphatase RsbU (regulator of sigma subunit)|nr:tetratricopeptide repeat protein [Raineya sp.]
MKYIFILYLFLSSTIISAQEKIDSLQKALQNNSGEKEVEILSALSQEWLFKNQENAFKYAFMSLQKSQTIKYKVGEASAYNALGNAYLLRAKEGDIKEAYKAYSKTLDILISAKTQKEETEKAKAMSGLANVYYQWGEYKEATILNINSLTIREKYNDEFGKARCYTTSGIIYDALSDYKKATLEYTKALNIYEKLKKKREIAGILNNLAASLKLQIETSEETSVNIDYSQIVDYYNRSLKISEELNDKAGIARTYNNLGILAQSQKNYEKALMFYEKSVEISLSVDDKQGLASTYNNIAKVYKEQKNLDKALQFYEKALETADEGESKFELYITLKERSLVYAEKNLYYEAYTDLLVSNALKNQLDEIENLRAISSLTSKYEIEKYQKENNKLRYEADMLRYGAEIKKQEDQILWGFIGFLFLMIGLVAVFLYRQNQLKENHNKKLQKINHELQDKNTEIKKQSLELNLQKQAIEEKNKEIEEKSKALQENFEKLAERNQALQDSIVYAKSIQQTILPTQEDLNQVFDDMIIYYRPKSMLSGDFYWITQNQDYKILVCGDCTGHGVPGAMMTMMATALLNEIILAHQVYEPVKILNMMDDKIKKYKSDRYGADGMDLAILCVNKHKKEIVFAGAKMGLLYYQDGMMKQIKASRYAISGLVSENKNFTQETLEYTDSILCYMHSDGVIDQFGEETNKKFKINRLEQTLLQNIHLPLPEQKVQLGKTLTIWKGELPQTDDMILVGVRV